MKNLQGKNAILTGGSYGIGPYIARQLAKEGVNIALVARSADKLKEVAEEISQMGVKAIAIPADITDPIAREAMLSKARSELGQIDILINNAGSHHVGRLHKRSPEQIVEVIQTNLSAGLLLTRAVLPDMLNRKQGHLVHISSLAGKVGIPYASIYDSTKYGLVGFNHGLQAELRGSGVHSSAVCSGYAKNDGMWHRFNRRVHPAFGLNSPARVARSVVRAVKRNKVETIVNPLPVRPVIFLWSFAPSIAAFVFHILGVNKFMRGAALQFEAEKPA